MGHGERDALGFILGPTYSVERFAFGVPFLKTGVDFVTVLIGLFAIGEVLEQMVLRPRETAV